ncbi:alkaline phosphatase D [Rhodopirellula sp. SWK7]|nr:alkaline phosphatase D [Rhodopirellula sp. SWK7]
MYSKNDCIHQFHLADLKPDTAYSVLVEGRKGGNSCQLEGGFRTAPLASDSSDIRFVVTTCGDYPRRDDPDMGHKIYPQMLSLDPDFFVHTGDIEYYDRPYPYATNLDLARFKWNRIYSMPFLRDFHNQVSSYFMKDDHDTTKNDAWPGKDYFDLTWQQGLATFREQVPMGEKTYRTFRWGQDLQIWLIEGRDFRSANTLPDGPDKTIWGAEQKQWFYDTVKASDATFKVLLSPTPIVGPDRIKGKNDNHSNTAFAHEGNEIRAFLAAQPNMYVVNGDRHWQYASIDPKTGLREFSCGPASDVHASGYKEEFYGEMHRFLRIKGGFLRVDVDSSEQKIHFRHHAVNGDVVNEESFTAVK